MEFWEDNTAQQAEARWEAELKQPTTTIKTNNAGDLLLPVQDNPTCKGEFAVEYQRKLHVSSNVTDKDMLTDAPAMGKRVWKEANVPGPGVPDVRRSGP